MAKSVMMSMVFAVVLLLKSAAIPTPHAVEEGIWVTGVAFKSLAAGAGKEFFVGERLSKYYYFFLKRQNFIHQHKGRKKETEGDQKPHPDTKTAAAKTETTAAQNETSQQTEINPDFISKNTNKIKPDIEASAARRANKPKHTKSKEAEQSAGTRQAPEPRRQPHRNCSRHAQTQKKTEKTEEKTHSSTLTFAPNSNEKRLKRVTKAAYKRCNALNYIEDLTTDGNGQVNVTFYLAGDYYYISPSFDYCKRGLKVHISVSATPEASPSPIPLGSSSPAVSVGVLVPMMAVVMGFFF